ncbi:hypothetical protein AB7714_19910 [Tardiphaga sp. 1201_B9_N1_1]|uniref:hypothetical protein n=1 Tax=unclassified Tardiphaga TaxID=2631404 RepID=UPI003F238039
MKLDHTLALSRLRAEYRSWIEERLAGWGPAVFISLNFKDSRLADSGSYMRLTEQVARREVELFGKRLDRLIHGRLVQRFNRRVRRIPILEYGYDRGWHAHVFAELPAKMGELRFRKALREAWSVSLWSTSIHQREADADGAAYATKFRSKGEFEAWTDTIILEAVVVDTK